MSMMLPRIIGHRGASGSAPENTLAAFRAAAAAGAKMVEFDVTLSRDGVPVVIHDDTLERTTNGRGNVTDHTAEELAGLDAGSWFSAEFAGEPLPTLAAVIAELARLGVSANVEIKRNIGREAETGRAVALAVRAQWPDSLPTPLISSFDWPTLAAAREATPEIPRGALMETLAPDWLETVRRLECATVNLDWRAADAEAFAALAAARVPLVLWTVNEVEAARRFLASGAAAIITDFPERMSGLQRAVE